MTTVRVYMPLTGAELRSLREQRRLARRDDVAFMVTAAVRSAYPGDDEEDLEYAALWAATDATRRAAPDAAVVVAAVDAPAAVVRPAGAGAPGTQADDEAYAVHVDADIAPPQVVSFHVGAAGAPPDDELDWYDSSELGAVLELI